MSINYNEIVCSSHVVVQIIRAPNKPSVCHPECSHKAFVLLFGFVSPRALSVWYSHIASTARCHHWSLLVSASFAAWVTSLFAHFQTFESVSRRKMDCSDDSAQTRKRGRPQGWRKPSLDESVPRRRSSRLGKREDHRVSKGSQIFTFRSC